jgi:Secretion system C-terminal sorting domain
LQITNDVTVTAGTFDISNQDIEIGGDWINASSTADPLIEGTRNVTFDGTASQSISNTGSANAMVFSNIVVNNTSTLIPQITLNTTLQALNGLTLTAGKVNLNSNTFTLGTSAATPGTLLRTSDYVYGGTFSRWFPTALFAIGNVAGLFPMGTSQNDYRPLWVGYSSNLTTGGIISVQHNPTYPSTYVAATHNDASWGNTLQGVSNSIWVVTTSTLAFTGSTGIIRFGGTGFGTNTLADLNASLLASVIGTHGAATNVNTTYEVNRTALSTANLANSWRIGTRNVLASPLPITLLNFTSEIKEDKVVLNWRTASEKNSDFITLERAADGIHFVEIDRKKAQGNSNSIVDYQSLDISPEPELNYYRLKLIDKDGSYVFSKILVERLDPSRSSLLIFPNPTRGKVEFDIPNQQEIISVSVYNALGEMLRTYPGSLTGIDLSKEADGVYFLQFNYLGKNVVKRIILSHR